MKSSSEILKKIDWWLAGVCLARTFNMIIFMTFAAAIPVLQKAWGMSASAAGSISGAFNIGYALSLIVFSSLADRFSPKSLYLGSMTAGAALSVVFAFGARDYTSGLILYLLVALSLGGNYTTGLMILAEQYPAQKRGMSIGFFIASSSFGYALSLLISGIMLPIGGYKLSFLATGFGPVVGAILAWYTLRNTRVSVQPRRKDHGFVKDVIKNRPAMMLIGGYTFHSWELLGMWAWTPAFITSCLIFTGALKVEAAGTGSSITAFFHITGLIASFSMGMLSDRIGRGRVLLMMAVVSTLCSFVFGWTIGLPFLVIFGIGLLYAFSALGDSPVLSAALTENMEPSYLGASFGFRSLLGFGAGAVSPLVFGAVLDLTNKGIGDPSHYTTWGWAFTALGVGGLFACVTAYLFLKKREGRR